MDKSWIQLPYRYDPEYIKGLEEFLELARAHTDRSNRARCPCRICRNLTFRPINEVEDHLYEHGMHKNYTHWEWHGESANEETRDDEDEDGDDIYEVLEDLCTGKIMEMHESNVQQRKTSTSHSFNLPEEESEYEGFDRLLSDADCELYPGCTEFSKLSFLVQLFHLKVQGRWSNKSFNMLLELLKKAFPKGETLPKSLYETKNIMRELGLGYTPIHACKNDCILFWKEHEHRNECPECGESRYKKDEGKSKKVPHKVLRFFPLTPRLQRLFMSRKTATDMRWHKEKHVKEINVLRHPVDSKVWEEFDKEHGWFANDPRNVRLGLSSDGFNPFGNMNNAYSMWPVIVTPYNLPYWKCMKEPYLYMSLLIPGPRSPGKDIDVYLRPLIDELKELWVNGIVTYDAFTRKKFKLHAAVLWTINDLPAFADLSGWCTKGYMACPTCNKDTYSIRLMHGKKICYPCHRRFLPQDHAWRKRSKKFDGKKENRLPPKELTAYDVLEQLEQVTPTRFGKTSNNRKRKRPKNELNWTKKSIFFELPYWRTLKLRHNLDVMHIEKNICDNVLGTLMNIEGKTKDTIKTRMDLEAMGIRKELHLVQKGDKFVIPPASYTLSVKEKKSFCEWLKSIKFPDGYASNISRCVNTNDCKISGLKSHDSHVLLQRILPIGIRGYLPNDVCNALIELGMFFKELCCKTLKLEVLEALEKDIVVILCKLEMIFPPSFFDVMVHLAVHLPREAILAGPVQYRWMFPIERFLHTLKLYVRNKARPEGSIAEAYIDSECVTFCSMYFRGVETRFNKEERNNDGAQTTERVGMSIFRNTVRAFGSASYDTMDVADLNKARMYVLNNCAEVRSYLAEHLELVREQNPENAKELHAKQFVKWFEERIIMLRHHKSTIATDDMYSLACGPDPRVKRYTGCIVNGIRFHTIERERHRKTQNSGVVVKGDKQSGEMEFYGVLTDIIELRYGIGKSVYLFRCDWCDVSNKRGIQKDAYFTTVNFSHISYKDDPFVLATQAAQVFYVKDTKLRGSWEVVQKINNRNLFDLPEAKEGVEEEGDNARDSAYQEHESFEIGGVVKLDGDMELLELNREDLAPNHVDADVILDGQQLTEEDDNFIDDEDVSEENDSLMNDFSDGENIFPSDDDTDDDLM